MNKRCFAVLIALGISGANQIQAQVALNSVAELNTAVCREERQKVREQVQASHQATLMLKQEFREEAREAASKLRDLAVKLAAEQKERTGRRARDRE